jgi:uncharacterized GH25 family protein
MNRLPLLASVIAALLTAPILHAHDFWIEPSSFHPEVGMTVAIGLRVGQNFVGDQVRRTAPLIESFMVRQAGRDEPITGIDGADPAGWFRADGRATAVVAYQSRPSFVEVPAATFEEYLQLEGLEQIAAIRKQRGRADTSGREYFSRYAKALLTGRDASDAVSRPLGLRYEIVPDTDPTAHRGPLRGRVLYDGEPLSGALVVAMSEAAPSARLTARTDNAGAFSLALPRGGVWLIKSVHMVDTWWWSRADWESFWASLTFEAPDGIADERSGGA